MKFLREVNMLWNEVIDREKIYETRGNNDGEQQPLHLLIA